MLADVCPLFFNMFEVQLGSRRVAAGDKGLSQGKYHHKRWTNVPNNPSVPSTRNQNYIVPKSCGSKDFDGSPGRWALPENAQRHEKVCEQKCKNLKRPALAVQANDRCTYYVGRNDGAGPNSTTP